MDHIFHEHGNKETQEVLGKIWDRLNKMKNTLRKYICKYQVKLSKSNCLLFKNFFSLYNLYII